MNTERYRIKNLIEAHIKKNNMILREDDIHAHFRKCASYNSYIISESLEELERTRRINKLPNGIFTKIGKE